MTLSYILNFDKLFVQRNPAIGPMTGGRDPYVERLTQAYQEFFRPQIHPKNVKNKGFSSNRSS